MHSKARWTIFSENVAFWNRWCLRTYIRGYFLTKRGLVFIQLSVARENSFFNKCVLVFDVTLVTELYLTTEEFPDITFRLFIGRIPPDQLVISLSVIKRPKFFYGNPSDGVNCLWHSANLPRIDCTRLITCIICANYSRNVIPWRNQR